MSWQRRLIELACAGGAIASAGCPVAGPGCGNANPDPCICNRHPASDPQCVAEKKCEDNGGSWEFTTDPFPTTDAGTQLWGHCGGYPLDAGPPDAPMTLDATPRD
jgi:hypothetical protein